MVRPLIDFTADASTATLTSSNGDVYADGDWRAYYVPTDTTAFFNSYDTMIVNEANAAKAGGAQLFDIGTELDQLTGSQYLTQWTKIINDVKGVFQGTSIKLTYSAISDDDLSPWQYSPSASLTTMPAAGTGNITTQVSFWSQLDYVGIDEYAALSNLNSDNGGADPTVAQLVQAWEQPFTDDGTGTNTDTTAEQTGGVSLIQYYENISTTLGKPLLFTELGYNSAPDAATQPFFTSSNTYDPTLQANLYAAFIQAWKDHGNTSLQGVYLWNWEPDPTTVGAGTSPSWTPQDNTGGLQVLDSAFSAATAACYVQGTRIATPGGPVPIEALTPGMIVLTASSGQRPVQWLGYRRLDITRHPRPHEVIPIRIEPNAFGQGLPLRPLIVSPGHGTPFDGTLVPVEHLVNGISIRPMPCDQVVYWHLELDAHDCVLAEGVPSESYLDCGNRSAFENGGAGMDLHPNFAASPGTATTDWPRAHCGAVVDEFHTEILALLDRQGAFTADPHLRVLANGHALDLAPHGHFIIPPGTRSIQLVSRAARPRDVIPGSGDHRSLGIMLHALDLDGQAVALDDIRLAGGWHTVESGNRWTDGSATIDVSGATRLTLRFHTLGRYHNVAPREAARRTRSI